jgi:hypothetical protein
VHGYLYALLSCDILSILGDLKFAPPSEDSKSHHVVLMIFSPIPISIETPTPIPHTSEEK